MHDVRLLLNFKHFDELSDGGQDIYLENWIALTFPPDMEQHLKLIQLLP